MLIVCPHCAASYSVTPESLGESGRSVRCVTCQNVWFEEPPRQDFESADSFGISRHESASIRPSPDDEAGIGLTDWHEPPEVTSFDENERGLGTIDRDIQHFSENFENPPLQAGPSIIPAADPALDDRDYSRAHDVESLAARRPGKRASRPRQWSFRPSLPGVICAMILIVAGLVVARQQVVRQLPQTASLYAAIGLPVNLRGLAFDNIKTVREAQDGVPVLVVEGDIVATAGRLIEVPRLRFAVVDGSGKEIYAWTAQPSRTLLPPGETLNFRSRLASPPVDASSITVRFFNRQDAATGFM